MPKLKEKEKAINLRKDGLSYSEILAKIPVAKSTLSLWLRSVGMSKRQKQKLTEKRILAQLKGAKAKREQRIRLTEEIKEKAIKEIGKITNRDLWMIGTALYWGEGTKEKENGRWSGKVILSNSDPYMILLFRKWLREICLIAEKELTYDLYIHITADWKRSKKYWAEILSIPEESIKIYFKKHKVHTKRKNIGVNYHGLIKLQVKKSTNLNRKIQGWIEGMYKNCGVV